MRLISPVTASALCASALYIIFFCYWEAFTSRKERASIKNKILITFIIDEFLCIFAARKNEIIHEENPLSQAEKIHSSRKQITFWLTKNNVKMETVNGHAMVQSLFLSSCIRKIHSHFEKCVQRTLWRRGHRCENERNQWKMFAILTPTNSFCAARFGVWECANQPQHLMLHWKAFFKQRK